MWEDIADEEEQFGTGFKELEDVDWHFLYFFDKMAKKLEEIDRCEITGEQQLE